jgi:hypothetical protein
MLIGSALVFGGAILCSLLGPATSMWAVWASALVAGVGLGLVATSTMVAVQSAAGWAHRGVVTASNMFCRSVGSAVGAAAFGAVANATLVGRLSHPPRDALGHFPSGVNAASDTLLRQPELRHSAIGVFLEQALYVAVHNVFIGLAVAAGLGLAVATIMPRRAESSKLS